MAYLLAESQSIYGRHYELDQDEHIMGRHPECHIVLDAGAVSRQHARIVASEGRFLLEDLNSRNGTFLNGKLIHQATELTDGDLIRICDLEFSYHDVQQSEMKAVQRAEGSGFGILMVDDPEDSSARAVTGKIDLSSIGTQLMVSPEIRLAALVEIMQNLGGSISLEEVLPRVLDSLFKVFIQADRGFIVLREPDGELRPRWVKARREDQEESVRISRTVLRRIMEHKEAIISLDATADERFEMSQSVADFRIRSMLVAPLLNNQGEPIGAIQLDTLNQRNRFEEKDLELLVAVATQAGIAIENAQLHEQVVAQKLVEQDLLLAKQVQAAYLPKSYPAAPGYEFFQFYQAANQIGGDYFDYIVLGPNKVAIVVADVVGHGVAAAMFMAKLSAETRFTFGTKPDPTDAITLLNARMYGLDLEKMVTMLVFILDTTTGAAQIVNAGHMAPIVRRKDGSLVEPSMEESGVPLCILDDSTYELTNFQLEPGDLVAMYTDGVFEAPNAKGEQFSINRIRQIISANGGQVARTGKTIIDSVRRHIGDCPQEDDMCLVIFGRNV